MAAGRADICFLAIEPAREAEVAFTAPYVVIEGVFAVPADSALATAGDVDRAGVRIGVKQGSAYDLFLSRTLQQRERRAGEEGVDVFREQGLEVAAGIRQPMTEFVAAHPELRLIEDRFMQIRQAVGTTRARRPETVQFLAGARRGAEGRRVRRRLPAAGAGSPKPWSRRPDRRRRPEWPRPACRMAPPPRAGPSTGTGTYRARTAPATPAGTGA